jgi:6-phosphogluconolactonase
MTLKSVQPTRWHAVANAQALQHLALETILDKADEAVRQRGQFHIVLAGGETPRALYAALSLVQTDWSAWYIYFGDERCLPVTHMERNSLMANRVWLDHVPIPKSHIHTIPAELGAVQGAHLYADQLKTVDAFDLVLLGLGEDGHTASLFPGHDWGMAANSPDTLAVLDAPKPPPQRISLSAARLSRARQVIFMIGGQSKHQAVTDWRAGKNIPAQAIAPATGVDVLIEESLLIPLSCEGSVHG